VRKSALTLLLLIVGLSGAPALTAQSTLTQTQALKIYVNPMGGGDVAENNMLTAKLVSHLVKHGVAVVEAIDDADAVLTGSGVVLTAPRGDGQVGYRIQAGMRLVNKDGAVIWADDVKSSRFSESASTSFSENVAKSVAQALAQKDQKIALR
jgi:hypothetical protein